MSALKFHQNKGRNSGEGKKNSIKRMNSLIFWRVVLFPFHSYIIKTSYKVAKIIEGYLNLLSCISVYCSLSDTPFSIPSVLEVSHCIIYYLGWRKIDFLSFVCQHIHLNIPKYTVELCILPNSHAISGTNFLHEII